MGVTFETQIEEICLEVYGSAEQVTAFELLERLMAMPELPMHCPPHHYMMPALLLTVVGKAAGTPEKLFRRQLSEAKTRALNVKGGFCGWYGDCGAAVGVGIFLSVYTKCSPHKEEHWADCQRATAHALLKIAEVDGPRCCKRNSFLALLSAIDTVQEVLGISLEKPEQHRCTYFEQNEECKREACPFFDLKR